MKQQTQDVGAALRAIGLSTYQSRAFKVLLKREMTLKELSSEAKIPPGKVYSIAKELTERKLISSANCRPKKLYVTNASGMIAKLIKEHESKSDCLIRTLHDIATQADSGAGRSTQFFEIGTSLEDNTIIQLRTFAEAEKEVLQILNIHHKPNANRRSKLVWEKEIAKAVDRGVVFRVIYPDNVALPKLLGELAKKKPSMFQTRRNNTDFIRCDIIDGKKVLVKITHEDPILFGGVIFIEDKKLASNLRTIFLKLWEESE